MRKWSGKMTGGPATEDVALRKVWFLDVQGSTCPVEVEDQVRLMWQWDDQLTNDNSIIRTDLLELRTWWDEDTYVSPDVAHLPKPDTNLIADYIEEMEPGIQETDLILIHWWW